MFLISMFLGPHAPDVQTSRPSFFLLLLQELRDFQNPQPVQTY